jgi:hypothetical protein
MGSHPPMPKYKRLHDVGKSRFNNQRKENIKDLRGWYRVTL